MDLNYQGQCRGEGKIYLLFQADRSCAIESRSRLMSGVSAFTSVVPLPRHQFVISVADLSVPQLLTISAYADDGAVASRKRLIVPLVASIASKINGKFKPEICRLIRNVDNSGSLKPVSFSLTDWVPCINATLLKGVVNSSVDSHSFRVAAYNSRMEKIGEDILASSEVKKNANGLSAQSIEFSIKLEALSDRLVLALYDGDTENSIAFLSFLPKRLHEFSEASFRRYSSAFEDPRYFDWLATVRVTGSQAQFQRDYKFKSTPLFSIIVPLYKTPELFFVEMVESVLRQTYANWELILVNSTPDYENLDDLVKSYVELDSRIKVVELEDNYGITRNTAYGVDAASGNYICFFDHDDTLEPDILFEYALAVNRDPEIVMLYCDEDKLFEDGRYGNPTFKPDFSLDMVRDNNYICHMLTVKAAVYRSLEPSGPELDGAQDHATVLKMYETGGHICHIPRVLYHWRISSTSTAGNAGSKPYASQAGILAVQQHLDRLGVPARVTLSHGRDFRYRVDYDVPKETSVSIIVSSRADSTLTEFLRAIDFSGKRGIALELILAVSNCDLDAARAIVSAFDSDISTQVIGMDEKFRYSKWMNEAAHHAHGNCLIFLHDDIAPLVEDWLEVLVGHAMRPDVGLVGTMLCNPDLTIQQSGMAVIGDDVVPLSIGNYHDSPGYIFYPQTTRNVSALGGACLAISTDVFTRLGGFCESYKYDYANVDLAFRVSKEGLLVVYTPEAKMMHQARTVGLLAGQGWSSGHYHDKAILLKTWSERFESGDCYFNVNFSTDFWGASHFQLREDANGIRSVGL